MIDFAKQVQITREANKLTNSILANQDDVIDRNKVISSIKDLSVAKEVIKCLLDKVKERE